MDFKEYPSYKNSGVEWLGDVPEHWEVIPSKFYFIERKEKAESSDKQLTASQKHGIIFQEDFMAENGRVMVVMKNPEILKKVRPNDFVISMRSFQGGLELSYLEGSISSAYVMLKPNLNVVDIEYFKYLFKTPRYIQSLQSTSNLIRDGQALRFNNFSQVKLVLPPKADQQKIVAFLDTETTRIDNLIAKQEKLIELLEEQRKSIISHAVTKGLNPNAPMKDSGVEWLGDVPEHWNLKRFGYLFDENKKKNIGLKETNVLSLSYGNIKEKNIDDNKGLLPESFETYQIIEPNNIVFRFTDLQNDKRSLRSAISKYHGIITSAYIAVKTKQNADFYNYLFRAYDLQKVFYSMGEGMRQSLKMDELNKMPVVLPNKDEQKRIVSFLDIETARIDNLIAKQEKLIELLEEQRKSIISHAVTGKIDVREFGA